MLKINNNNINDCYNFKTIYLSSYIIHALVNFDNNNIFISIFNKKEIDKNKNINKYFKLFLLQIAISYRHTYLKLSKIISLYNKNLFPLIFSEIFFIPFLHNFDKVFSNITKKIDLVLFGNSEYISSIIYDMDKKEILYDTGYLVQKNYKSSFIDFSKKNKIMEEINFYGQKLKNNYLKSSDKNIDKIENCIKLELRATFPKPLFILRFFPILKGVLIIHVFHQYKLSKIQVINPMNNNEFIYERYKEIDAVLFDFLNKLEEFNANEIVFIEKFFFEYFLILGSNIKEVGRNSGNFNKNLMTYKSKEFNLIYLNKQILQIIKDIIAQFFLGNNQNNKDYKNLIDKIKRKLGSEYEKNKNEIDLNNNNINNTNNIVEENILTKSEKINLNNKSENSNTNTNMNELYNNNLSKAKEALEFNFINFIQEFDLNKIFPKEININNNNTIKEEIDNTINNNTNNDKNNIINTNDINIQFQDDYSNVNEYSNLNLSKDNLELIKRTIITSATRVNLISKTNTNTNTNMITTNRNTRSNTNLIGINNNYNNNEKNNANIYGNYELFNTETRNLKTEEEKEEYVEYNKDDPFKVDITSIQNNINNIEISKEESDLKSILTKKEKNN